MAVGEIFLGLFLQVLLDKLASEFILPFARREGISKLLEKWSRRLQFMKAVINDADDKQLTDGAVKLWLDQLRDLAYDLDDVLDEITTYALIEKSRAPVPDPTPMCGPGFIPIIRDWTPDAFNFKRKMKSKIERISVQFDEIANIESSLNLRPNAGLPANQLMNRLPSTSVPEPYVCGRDKDKEAVVGKLVTGSREHSVCVIPIVGMGGIGKTTLAQLIYNDETVSSNFEPTVWICVSMAFDVFSITKTIYHSVTKLSADDKDLNLLQESLQKELSTKKFLLVLDDVWIDDYVEWRSFFLPFTVGMQGSTVLVTTRNSNTAKMVGSIPPYQVNKLSDHDCASLLAQHSLAKRDFDEHPALKETGEALAKKCGGLPLAAKTLGGLLRTKQSPGEWEDVLSSMIWNLPMVNDILPALRLSYHDLPADLKNLFAYCSIFPKGYEFDNFQLVLLWMGAGFLPDCGRKTKEQLGLEYFDELLARSFFQLSTNSSLFVMHDLISDLAQSVAGEICYKLDETSGECRISNKARHASFLRHEYECFKKFTGFNQVKGLRTFLPMPVQNIHTGPPFYMSNKILFKLLPKLHSLRVLSLSGYSVTKLPDSIFKLIHLRYLNLSGTSIDSLPDCVSDLYNLETLSIRNCRLISRLPPSIGDLVNLRHLDNSNTDQLKELPVEIKKLGSLQSLPKVILSKDGGFGLKELGKLNFLRGTVALMELQNVTDIEDAKESCLRLKDEIEELQLTWTKDFTDISRDAHLEEELLDALQPHENLRKLMIDFYGGVRFPSWIGDPSFSKIISISISGCSKCSSLPSLGLLPELRHLRIGDMPGIRQIQVEHSGKSVFTKLETLRFEHLPNWEEWSSSYSVRIQFPALCHFTILNCPKLAMVSHLSLPSLHQLDLEKCNMSVLRSLTNLDSLCYLKIESVSGLSNLPSEFVESIAKIEVLECSSCNELLSLWPNGASLQHLTRLRRLVVAECSQFVNMSEELPGNLEILELFGCANLTSLPNSLRNLTSLRELIIKNCRRIVNFPEDGIPSSLKHLEIISCEALESLPNDVSNIERLKIEKCPNLKTWNFPQWLRKLSIKNCSKLEPVSEEIFPANRRVSLDELSICDWANSGSLLQNVHKFSFLGELRLSKCDSLKYFPNEGLPPSLRTLSVKDCSNLISLPNQFQNMRSITSIVIRSCRKLERFPLCDFPPNLCSLRIWDSSKLRPLSQWGLHRLASLREFSIRGGFQDLELLANDRSHSLFPCSLLKFSIARFPMLRSLSGVLENLCCLQNMSIVNCPKLGGLPSDDLLEKLWKLEISECWLLEKRCLRDGGDYWQKITGIPCVEINGVILEARNLKSWSESFLSLRLNKFCIDSDPFELGYYNMIVPSGMLVSESMEGFSEDEDSEKTETDDFGEKLKPYVPGVPLDIEPLNDNYDDASASDPFFKINPTEEVEDELDSDGEIPLEEVVITLPHKRTRKDMIEENTRD